MKKVIHVCKNCEKKNSKEKCPHFERLKGNLPNNGTCKSFKKPILDRGNV